MSVTRSFLNVTKSTALFTAVGLKKLVTDAEFLGLTACGTFLISASHDLAGGTAKLIPELVEKSDMFNAAFIGTGASVCTALMFATGCGMFGTAANSILKSMKREKETDLAPTQPV